MKEHKGKTVEFKLDGLAVMEVLSLEGKSLGKIKLGDKPNYILRTVQNAEFSSEQLAEISAGMRG